MGNDPDDDELGETSEELVGRGVGRGVNELGETTEELVSTMMETEMIHSTNDDDDDACNER